MRRLTEEMIHGTPMRDGLRDLLRRIADRAFVREQHARRPSRLEDELTSLSGQLDDSRHEVSRLRNELQAVRREVSLDGLTGLLNRRAFDDAIDRLCTLAPRERRGFSLILIDADHFKSINDSFGHLVGDQVLRAVAGVLTSHIKGKDTLARYGGEEFAVLLPDTSIASASVVAEQLLAAVSEVALGRPGGADDRIAITVSAGVACWCTADQPRDLIDRADKALYRAKRDGRNRVAVQHALP